MKKNMKIFALILAAAVMLAAIPAYAQQGLRDVDNIIKDSGLSSLAGRTHDLSSVDPGADIITSIIFSAIDLLKYFMGAIAVLFLIIGGAKLVIAGKKIDEISEKSKENFKYIIYGLILIITADELVTKVFFGDYGECVASASNAAECAKVGGSLVKGVYSLMLTILGTASIFIFVLSAFRLVTAFGNEETVEKNKKHLGWAIVGLLLAGIGEFIIKQIIFPASGQKGIDVGAAQALVFNFTNFIAAFIGAAAFLMLFYGGWLYVVSFGNEEKTGKAKKIIIGAFVGIAIALAAFGIVRTISTLSPAKNIELPRDLPSLPEQPR